MEDILAELVVVFFVEWLVEWVVVELWRRKLLVCKKQRGRRYL